MYLFIYILYIYIYITGVWQDVFQTGGPHAAGTTKGGGVCAHAHTHARTHACPEGGGGEGAGGGVAGIRGKGMQGVQGVVYAWCDSEEKGKKTGSVCICEGEE